MKSFLPGLAIIFLLLSCGVEKKALKEFRKGNFQTSIDLHKKVLAKEPTNPKVNFMVAEAYRQSNRIAEAESFYSKAGGRGFDKDTILFYYSMALKANEKYQEAENKLTELMATTANTRLKDRAATEKSGLGYLVNLDAKSSYYKIRNLEAINTPYSEYNPVFLNNELYFTSTRANEKIYEATGTPFSEIFKVASPGGANVDNTTVKALPSGINTPGVNDGCITFTPDGKTMIFAKGNTSKKKGMNATPDVDLYISRFRSGSWSEPVPININLPDAWDSSPAFASDGRTLYFASNRKMRGKDVASYGGLDIYAATMDSRGRFSRVRNMGPIINTSGNEMFPYVSEAGTLYFSSDGHPGYGGLDLFVVKRANGKTQIENLGKPMNSNADDFGIFLFKADRGFFTSNRTGGKGDDDIYTFRNEDPNLRVVNYFLEGVTYTMDKDGNRQVLQNTKVNLIDSDGEVMQDYTTGTDGKFLFKVYENENYNLTGETDGYLVKRQTYTTKGKSVDVTTLKDLVTNITLDTLMILDRIDTTRSFVLENIFYDFGKFNIRQDAATELDKLVQLLLDNPEIAIELSSHTDSVDTDAFNLRLSQQRAESAVNYLIQRGISPDRLKAKGYGERKPIARNTNPDGSDNPVGRQKNRRTEFKILKVNLLPKPIEDAIINDEDRFFKNDGG